MLASASALATPAPTVTAAGRSPVSSGSSCARTAAFLASEREARGAGAARGGAGRGAVAGSARRFLLRLPTHRLPAERVAQRGGGSGRAGSVAAPAHDG